MLSAGGRPVAIHFRPALGGHPGLLVPQLRRGPGQVLARADAAPVHGRGGRHGRPAPPRPGQGRPGVQDGAGQPAAHGGRGLRRAAVRGRRGPSTQHARASTPPTSCSAGRPCAPRPAGLLQRVGQLQAGGELVGSGRSREEAVASILGERTGRLAQSVTSSSRVGIVSVPAVAPHAHAMLGATARHSCQVCCRGKPPQAACRNAPCLVAQPLTSARSASTDDPADRSCLLESSIAAAGGLSPFSRPDIPLKTCCSKPSTSTLTSRGCSTVT